MHERTTIHRAGRSPPADGDYLRIAASWRATHRLSTPDLHWLVLHAAGRGVSIGVALDELRRVPLAE